MILALFATVVAAPITMHKISDGECLEMAIDQKDAIDQMTMFAGVTVGSCASKGFFEQHGTKTLTLPFVGEVVCKRMLKPIAKASILKADAFLPVMPFSASTALKAVKADRPPVDDSWDQEKLSKFDQTSVFSTAVKRPEIPVTQDIFRVGMYKLNGDDCLQMRVPLLFKPAAMDFGGFKEGSCHSLGFTESGSTKRQIIAGVPAPLKVQTFSRTSADFEPPNAAPALPQQARLPWDRIPDPLKLDKFRLSLFKIDGDECLETRVGPVYKAAATAVGRWTEGTCSSLGYTALGDTTTARIPTAPMRVPVAVFTNPAITPDSSKASSKRKSATRGTPRENLEKLVDNYRIPMYKISASGKECSEARVDFAFFPAVATAGMWHQGSCMDQGFTVEGEAQKILIVGVPFSVSSRAFKKEEKTRTVVQQPSTTAKPSFQLYGPAQEAKENSEDPAHLWNREATARADLLARPLPTLQPNVQTPASTFNAPSTIADVFDKPGLEPQVGSSLGDAVNVPGTADDTENEATWWTQRLRDTETANTRNGPRPSIIDEFHTDPSFDLYGTPGSVANGRPKKAAQRWWRRGGKAKGNARTSSSGSELYGPGEKKAKGKARTARETKKTVGVGTLNGPSTTENEVLLN
jgi:hypothetical protein